MADDKLLLDTNIVSYLLKNHQIANYYLPHLHGKLLCISFITVGELFYWAESKKWGERKRSILETRLRNYVVIPYDYEIAKNYARVAVEREKKGRKIETNDAWIAACAIRHQVPLVTHNAKDFKIITDLQLITESQVDQK